MNDSDRKQLVAAKQRKPQYDELLRKWAKKKPKSLDLAMQDAHEEVFSDTDCLSCANCCKTTSPIFRDIDIERLSKKLRVKPSDLIAKYLHLDSDGDYVLNSSPCAFLGADNYCSVYDARPTACREYPHTDRKNFYQLSRITSNNLLICPAVSRIIDKIPFNLK
ncbi:MAG TPA: YkgJ family cysteine cluster protein [Luteibaculaceae bacterium]|nr:YkgJ family cysteine cluster protein [Luteibaculaceae bacterium]